VNAVRREELMLRAILTSMRFHNGTSEDAVDALSAKERAIHEERKRELLRVHARYARLIEIAGRDVAQGMYRIRLSRESIYIMLTEVWNNIAIAFEREEGAALAEEENEAGPSRKRKRTGSGKKKETKREPTWSPEM